MFDTEKYKKLMEEALGKFKEELKKVRTGRAHPDMLAGVKVEAYGQWMPLNQVANVTVSGATMLLITPYDPSTIPGISNAIRSDSTLGLNPSDDGRVVRVPIPPLTEERRKEIVKQVKKMSEDAKVALRNIRRDAVDAFKKKQKASEITEDDLKQAEKDLQKLTDDSCKKIDELLAKKEKELMAV